MQLKLSPRSSSDCLLDLRDRKWELVCCKELNIGNERNPLNVPLFELPVNSLELQNSVSNDMFKHVYSQNVELNHKTQVDFTEQLIPKKSLNKLNGTLRETMSRMPSFESISLSETSNALDDSCFNDDWITIESEFSPPIDRGMTLEAMDSQNDTLFTSKQLNNGPNFPVEKATFFLESNMGLSQRAAATSTTPVCNISSVTSAINSVGEISNASHSSSTSELPCTYGNTSSIFQVKNEMSNIKSAISEGYIAHDQQSKKVSVQNIKKEFLIPFEFSLEGGFLNYNKTFSNLYKVLSETEKTRDSKVWFTFRLVLKTKPLYASESEFYETKLNFFTFPLECAINFHIDCSCFDDWRLFSLKESSSVAVPIPKIKKESGRSMFQSLLFQFNHCIPFRLSWINYKQSQLNIILTETTIRPRICAAYQKLEYNILVLLNEKPSSGSQLILSASPTCTIENIYIENTRLHFSKSQTPEQTVISFIDVQCVKVTEATKTLELSVILSERLVYETALKLPVIKYVKGDNRFCFKQLLEYYDIYLKFKLLADWRLLTNPVLQIQEISDYCHFKLLKKVNRNLQIKTNYPTQEFHLLRPTIKILQISKHEYFLHFSSSYIFNDARERDVYGVKLSKNMWISWAYVDNCEANFFCKDGTYFFRTTSRKQILLLEIGILIKPERYNLFKYRVYLPQFLPPTDSRTLVEFQTIVYTNSTLLFDGSFYFSQNGGFDFEPRQNYTYFDFKSEFIILQNSYSIYGPAKNIIKLLLELIEVILNVNVSTTAMCLLTLLIGIYLILQVVFIYTN